MQMMDMVEQYRQFIGLVYGVSPIFSTGAAGQGLTNEGLQITVTNRTIAETQRVWNEFLRWLTSQLGIFDFKVELSRNELQDDMSKLSVERERVNIARQMVDLGFDVDMETLTDGTMNFRYKKIGKARSGGGGGGALSMPPAQGGEGASIQPDQRGGMIPENTEEPEAETEGEGA